ncbi:hypothetical protein [Cupriavidus gilardii]|nr:hypothetical protein [Cupriavidus gilardii]MCG5258688.1 hypothetical protein [Cupriavidus gilardii]
MRNKVIFTSHFTFVELVAEVCTCADPVTVIYKVIRGPTKGDAFGGESL